MKKRIGSYPRVRTEGAGRGVVSQTGGVLLVETIRKDGLDGLDRVDGQGDIGGVRGERHRSRSHRSGRTRPEAAAEEVPPWTADDHPHRLGRGHPRVRQLAVRTRPVAVLLGRHDHHRRHPSDRLEASRLGWTMAVEPGGQIRDGA